jgi:MoaA/NifB/PqqE/SkfB family radical SAM enzyme
MKCPSTIQFEITDDFNLKCLNCHYLNNKEEVVIKFSEANKEKIMQIAQKIVDLGVFQVILTGGEPLIKKNLVLDFVEFFSKHNISVCINTDLISLNESFLKDPRSRFIKSFLVSRALSDPKIYKEMTWDDNYDIFERNLKMLQKYNVYCFIALK